MTQNVSLLFLGTPSAMLSKSFPLNLNFINKHYGQPINLKFKANPEILIQHVVNIIPANFQSKFSSPGLLPAV